MSRATAAEAFLQSAKWNWGSEALEIIEEGDDDTDLAFDPSQPRDEKGRWIGIGASYNQKLRMVVLQSPGEPTSPELRQLRDAYPQAQSYKPLGARGGTPFPENAADNDSPDPVLVIKGKPIYDHALPEARGRLQKVLLGDGLRRVWEDASQTSGEEEVSHEDVIKADGRRGFASYLLDEGGAVGWYEPGTKTLQLTSEEESPSEETLREIRETMPAVTKLYLWEFDAMYDVRTGKKLNEAFVSNFDFSSIASGWRSNPFSDFAFDPSQLRDEKGRWARFAARGFAEPDAAERKQLGIPPAWKEVQISREPGAALLAVGLDAKGREQRVYSAAHHQQQAAAKFARIGKLHERLPEIDKRIEADAEADDTALAALMIRRMGLRPGSDQDTGAEKKAHGATNLKASHVTVRGNTVRAAFTGKKGVDLDLSIDDPLLARLLRKRKRGKGVDDRLLDTDERKLRSYMKSAAPGVKPKDFRTYLATATAMDLVAEVPDPPHNEREYKTLRKEVAKKVSRLLGNTPTVALTSYISPEVFGSWDTAVDFSEEDRDHAMIPSVERMHENVARLLSETRYAPATKVKLDEDGMPAVEPDTDDPEEDDHQDLAENPFSVIDLHLPGRHEQKKHGNRYKMVDGKRVLARAGGTKGATGAAKKEAGAAPKKPKPAKNETGKAKDKPKRATQEPFMTTPKADGSGMTPIYKDAPGPLAGKPHRIWILHGEGGTSLVFTPPQTTPKDDALMMRPFGGAAKMRNYGDFDPEEGLRIRGELVIPNTHHKQFARAYKGDLGGYQHGNQFVPFDPKVKIQKPVGDAIRVPATKTFEPSRDAIAAIARVHDDGNLPVIPLKGGIREKGLYGQYEYGRGGDAVDIKIKSDASRPRLTTAHEIGHFLDHKGIGRGPAGFASDSRDRDAETAPIMDAIRNSDASKKLLSMQVFPEDYEVEYSTAEGKLVRHRPDPNHLNYLTSSREVFARAYAQYIAMKSGDPKMRQELDSDVRAGRYAHRYPNQWEEEDFAPISKAFDKLFADRGWLK